MLNSSKTLDSSNYCPLYSQIKREKMQPCNITTSTWACGDGDDNDINKGLWHGQRQHQHEVAVATTCCVGLVDFKKVCNTKYMNCMYKFGCMDETCVNTTLVNAICVSKLCNRNIFYFLIPK